MAVERWSLALWDSRRAMAPRVSQPMTTARYLSCAIASASEACDLLDRGGRVGGHDLARHEIMPVLEFRLGAGFDDRLGSGRTDVRQLVEFRCRCRVEIGLGNLRSRCGAGGRGLRGRGRCDSGSGLCGLRWLRPLRKGRDG